MSDPPLLSEHDRMLAYIAQRFDQIEEKMMGKIDDLQAALDTLGANVQDLTSDVSATLADIKGQLDAALAKDSADAAALQEMSAGVDSALTKVQALNDAVSNADVPVNRP